MKYLVEGKFKVVNQENGKKVMLLMILEEVGRKRNCCNEKNDVEYGM